MREVLEREESENNIQIVSNWNGNGEEESIRKK